MRIAIFGSYFLSNNTKMTPRNTISSHKAGTMLFINIKNPILLELGKLKIISKFKEDRPNKML